MIQSIDDIDRRILIALQSDASLSMDDLSEKVSLSRNACWRRMRQMEEAGIIKGRVALIDPEAVGLGLLVLVLIKAGAHSPEWLEKFRRAVETMPDIVGAYRTSGDLDYVLRVRVADMKDYDRFYQQLIKRVPMGDVSASFVMDEIKETTALPL